VSRSGLLVELSIRRYAEGCSGARVAYLGSSSWFGRDRLRLYIDQADAGGLDARRTWIGSPASGSKSRTTLAISARSCGPEATTVTSLPRVIYEPTR